MSLFPQETPQEVMPESSRIIRMMRANNKRSLELRKQMFEMNFRHFWKSRELTRQICEELGTGASEWFTKSWKEQQAIKALDDTWEFLVPPFPFTINQDGTVLIEEITE